MERPTLHDRKESFSLSAIAAQEAIRRGIQHRSDLQITTHEIPMYIRKCVLLAACYSGFSQHASKIEALGAGKAAFLSCAYDVASDWGKGQSSLDAFEQIAYNEAPIDQADLAMKMLGKDLRGELDHDGLERGVISTQLVMQMMGVLDIYKLNTNIHELGMNLQIVDDVLDLEMDLKRTEQNCFNTPRAHDYAARLVNQLDAQTTLRLFPHGDILRWVIGKARQKAQWMLLDSMG